MKLLWHFPSINSFKPEAISHEWKKARGSRYKWYRKWRANVTELGMLVSKQRNFAFSSVFQIRTNSKSIFRGYYSSYPYPSSSLWLTIGTLCSWDCSFLSFSLPRWLGDLTMAGDSWPGQWKASHFFKFKYKPIGSRGRANNTWTEFRRLRN